MFSAHKLNKPGDNIQTWHTPFPIWNQSDVPCPVLTVASWPAYRFLKRQVRWSGIPISLGNNKCRDTAMKIFQTEAPRVKRPKNKTNKQKTNKKTSSVQFSSVDQSCPTLCDPMNRSTPGLPVHHQLPEFTQTHVHWVGDAIQPSHLLSSPSPPTFNLSQHHGLFTWVSSSHQVTEVLQFQLHHESFQWTLRTDLF